MHGRDRVMGHQMPHKDSLYCLRAPGPSRGLRRPAGSGRAGGQGRRTATADAVTLFPSRVNGSNRSGGRACAPRSLLDVARAESYNHRAQPMQTASRSAGVATVAPVPLRRRRVGAAVSRRSARDDRSVTGLRSFATVGAWSVCSRPLVRNPCERHVPTPAER